jgi:hypothetical protein
MSRNALKGIEPRTYLDDMESFYYVLLYIARINTDIELSSGGIPPLLTPWEDPTAASAMNGYILNKFDYDTDPRLGKSFQTLVGRLHSVFRNMLPQAFIAEGREEPPPLVIHEEIYNMMLSHIRVAIEWGNARWDHHTVQSSSCGGKY